MNRSTGLWVAVGIIFCWLVALTLFSLRQDYFVRSQELQLKLQMGMTRQEADKVWGSSPRLIDLGSSKLPQSMRGFSGGQVVRYSELMPSSYMYVHFGRDGRIDRVYFYRS